MKPEQLQAAKEIEAQIKHTESFVKNLTEMIENETPMNRMRIVDLNNKEFFVSFGDVKYIDENLSGKIQEEFQNFCERSVRIFEKHNKKLQKDFDNI